MHALCAACAFTRYYVYLKFTKKCGKLSPSRAISGRMSARAVTRRNFSTSPALGSQQHRTSNECRSTIGDDTVFPDTSPLSRCNHATPEYDSFLYEPGMLLHQSLASQNYTGNSYDDEQSDTELESSPANHSRSVSLLRENNDVAVM